MKRLRLSILAVLLSLVLLVFLPLVWLTATESGLRWLYPYAESYLPATVSIERVEGRLLGPITLSGVDYRQDQTRISADQILFDWQPLSLLSANIAVSRVYVRSLELTLPETEAAVATQTPALTALPEIHLPWRLALHDVWLDGVRLRQNGQTLRLEQVRLEASSLFNTLDIETLRITADNFELALSGELQPVGDYRHQLALEWQTTLPSSAVIRGRGTLAGDLQHSRVRQQLEGALQLTLDAELKDVLTQPNWTAEVAVSKFDSAQLDARLPPLSGTVKLDAKGDLDTAVVSGSAEATHAEFGAFDAVFALQRLDNRLIQIDTLKLHAATSQTELHAQGTWQPADNGGDVKLALNWQNLRWPLAPTSESCVAGADCTAAVTPWFNSASGEGTIAGNIDRYRFELTTDRPWPEAPPSSWTASAEGDRNGLRFDSLRVTALDGEAVASGQLQWSPALHWQAGINARNIDPSGLWPEWPGRLDAKISSSGQMQYADNNPGLVVETAIDSVSGSLRGQSVSLNSRLSWRDNGFDIAQLDFHSGDARFSAEGRLGETLALDWRITASNLTELYPKARGRLDANGHFSGPRDAPTIQARFNGENLGLAVGPLDVQVQADDRFNYRADKLDGAMVVDLLRWQQLDININAENLHIGNSAMQSFTISSSEDRIVATAVAEMLSAELELRGRPDAEGWHGRVERIDLNSQAFQDWRLKTPSAISITGRVIKSQPLCLSNGDSQACLDLQKQDAQWLAKLDAEQLPLLLLAPWSPADLKWLGTADASADLQYRFPDSLLGQASITLPPGAVSYPLIEGEREHWDYQGGTITLALSQQSIAARAEIAMSNGDRLHFKAELPEAQLLTLEAQQKLQASAQLSVHDLGPIEALLPEVQDLKGEFGFNLAASGTLGEPRLTGRAKLHNGSLRIPRLGLNIEQLSLNSQSSGQDKIYFHLAARSGDGDISINGQTTLNSKAGWPTEINLVGKDFEVSNIAEARLQVSPQLKLKLEHRRIDINGEVHVPYAKLQPRDITTATRVSDDVVISGGEQPAAENWQLYTRIRLTLGERVHFYGFGFEGRFGGSLLLQDEPGQLTRATGEINIPEGRYRAYGQRLEVEHGRLLYTGGPLTNPGLDLRAVRHVDTVTAGIRVRGSLNQPRLELFSIPAMGETDILAYLLLGGPIENASGEEGAMMAKAALALGLSGGDTLARRIGDRFGLDEMRVETSDKGDQASLVVGRYLSPKIYVSYGVGLVEAFNTLTVRYKISDSWHIKAESGEYQGADILYTIDR